MFGCGWLSEVLRVFRNPCGLSAPPHTPWYRICSLYFIDFFPYRMCSLSCNFRMCSQYIWYLYYLALLDCLLELGFAVLDIIYYLLLIIIYHHHYDSCHYLSPHALWQPYRMFSLSVTLESVLFITSRSLTACSSLVSQCLILTQMRTDSQKSVNT
jgi:hypothetical protein